MTSHYIQTLGVAKCREILSGAPANVSDAIVSGRQVFYGNGLIALRSVERFVNISDLRAELSLHDTDSCTDIANHISPNTVVLENNLQEQFQEANEAECGR